MWRKYNANRDGKNVGDCTVRAISEATGDTWNETYLGICLQGLEMADMPSANHVWGAYLKKKGFTKHIIPEEYPNIYTVEDFCNDHQQGVFVLALPNHVITVIDGDFYDTWDSGGETPLYYWHKDNERN